MSLQARLRHPRTTIHTPLQGPQDPSPPTPSTRVSFLHRSPLLPRARPCVMLSHCNGCAPSLCQEALLSPTATGPKSPRAPGARPPPPPPPLPNALTYRTGEPTRAESTARPRQCPRQGCPMQPRFMMPTGSRDRGHARLCLWHGNSPVIGGQLAASDVGHRGDPTALVLPVPDGARHLQHTQHTSVPKTGKQTLCDRLWVHGPWRQEGEPTAPAPPPHCQPWPPRTGTRLCAPVAPHTLWLARGGPQPALLTCLHLPTAKRARTGLGQTPQSPSGDLGMQPGLRAEAAERHFVLNLTDWEVPAGNWSQILKHHFLYVGCEHDFSYTVLYFAH